MNDGSTEALGARALGATLRASAFGPDSPPAPQPWTSARHRRRAGSCPQAFAVRCGRGDGWRRRRPAARCGSPDRGIQPRWQRHHHLRRTGQAAWRTPRSSFCYRLYCAAHWLLTGVRVRVGNFSIVPWQALERLVVVSELWNHYAAAIFRARLPYRTIPMDRGRRINGESKMNFVALLVHGLSAISVFSDIVSTRLLVMALSGYRGAGAVTVVTGSWRCHLAIPGWAGYAAAVSLLLLTQALFGAFLLVFTTISARANMSFIPLRDAHHFIDRQERVFPLDTLSIRRLRAGNL